MDNNGHSLLGLILMAVQPPNWPVWVRQVLVGASVVFITSFVGTSFALWREQAVIAEKIILTAALLQSQITRNDQDINDLRKSIQRAHERLSGHTEGHNSSTRQNK